MRIGGGGMPPVFGAAAPKIQIPMMPGLGQSGQEAGGPPPAPVRVQQPVIPSSLPGGPTKSEQSFQPRSGSGAGDPPPPPPIVRNNLIIFLFRRWLSLGLFMNDLMNIGM
jgi:hypothetical protein